MRQRQLIIGVKVSSVLLAIVLSACTDLRAVRDWSKTSLEATQFNEVVATYSDTPERVAFYDESGARFWKKQAEIRKAQAQALELQLSLVADYMAALFALSADSATDYTEDVGELTESLKRTGQVSNATVGAVGKLATTLANAAAKGWQQRKVGELIEEANRPLQNILSGELRSIVDKDFRRDLSVEAGFLDRHFKDLLRGGGSNAAKAALNEWFVLRREQNARRIAAVDAYVGVLEKISKGHQKLFDNRDDLDEVQLVKDLYKLAKEIRKNVNEIIKA